MCAELLDSASDLTAIVAANDLLAIGCYDTLEARGLRCPQDISIVGFNDMPFIDRLRPPLTSVRVPQREIGTVAADLLLQRLADGSQTAREILLEPTLVVRGSTAPPRRRARARRLGRGQMTAIDVHAHVIVAEMLRSAGSARGVAARRPAVTAATRWSSSTAARSAPRCTSSWSSTGSSPWPIAPGIDRSCCRPGCRCCSATSTRTRALRRCRLQNEGLARLRSRLPGAGQRARRGAAAGA